MSVLDLDGDSGNHEKHLIREPGSNLIGSPGEIPEPAPERTLWHDAGADFIGHQNHGERRAANRLAQAADLLRNLRLGVTPHQLVRDVHRQAVEDDAARLSIELGDRRDRICGTLEGVPMPGTLKPVAGDPLLHLSISRLARRDVDDATAKRLSQLHGESAFSAPRPACYQDESA